MLFRAVHRGLNLRIKKKSSVTLTYLSPTQQDTTEIAHLFTNIGWAPTVKNRRYPVNDNGYMIEATESERESLTAVGEAVDKWKKTWTTK